MENVFKNVVAHVEETAMRYSIICDAFGKKVGQIDNILILFFSI